MKKIGYIISFSLLLAGFLIDKKAINLVAAYRTTLLDSTFSFFTEAGTFIIIPLFVLSLIMFYKRANKKIAHVWLSVLVTLAVTYAIKYLVGRERPDIARAQASGPSFPSAHSSTSFAPIPFLDGSIKTVWTIFAVMVAASRVYLGVHYISDVIAGFILSNIVADAMKKINLSRYKLLKQLRIA